MGGEWAGVDGHRIPSLAPSQLCRCSPEPSTLEWLWELPTHLSNWHENPCPSTSGSRGQDGVGSCLPLCPAPLKACPRESQLTGPTLTAWPLCHAAAVPSTGSWHCPPLLVRTPEGWPLGMASTQPTVRSSFFRGIPHLPGVSSLHVCVHLAGWGGTGTRACPAACSSGLRPLLCKMWGGGRSGHRPWLPWRRAWCRVVPSQWCSPTFPREGVE